MNEIKNIYCFGTSFTAGGGFEWDGNNKDRVGLLEKYYSNTLEIKNQFHYSWPGQLQKILPNTKIHNLAKQGYGNDSMYRKCFEMANEVSFDNKQSIFLIEFSDFGRKEFYSTDLNDYIVCNYSHSNNDIRVNSIANSYHYDTPTTQRKLEVFFPIINNFMEKTFNENEEFKKISMETSFFLNWLAMKNIKTIFISKPIIFYENDKDVINQFTSINYDIYDGECYELFSFINKGFSIKDETNGGYDDFHAGYQTNKFISKLIYNKLVELKLINSIEYDIITEYENLKK
jgi:hypothetical protein